MYNKTIYVPELDSLKDNVEEFVDLLNTMKEDALKLKSLDESDVANAVMINEKLLETFNTIKFIKKLYNKKFSSVQQDLKDAVVVHSLFENESFNSVFEHDKVKSELSIGKTTRIVPMFLPKESVLIRERLLNTYPELATEIRIAFPSSVSFDKEKANAISDMLLKEHLIEVQEQLSMDLI
jgi:hypothetical protein